MMTSRGLRVGQWILVLTFLALCLIASVTYKSARLETAPDTSGYVHDFLRTEYAWTDVDGGRFLIPDDDALQNLSVVDRLRLLWRYVNSIQYLCWNQIRLGSLKDGGKEICIDREYMPSKSCLVYSFGSKLQTDFEQAVVQAFGCEVHTFDPSVSLKGYTPPKGVTFHLHGLSDKDFIYKAAKGKEWQMHTYSWFLNELNHKATTVDILKIDIEGSEWKAIPEMIQSGNLRYVKQLSIEIHFHAKDQYLRYLQVLRSLYNAGFRIFMREHNIYCIGKALGPAYPVTICNELSLVNTAYNPS